MLIRFFGRRQRCRIWRNSWLGLGFRLWPIWFLGVPWFVTAVNDPEMMTAEWRIVCLISVRASIAWAAIDHVAMCGEFVWFRGYWAPRRFRASEIVSVGEGGTYFYVTFKDRYRKDNLKTIRLDLSRFMLTKRRIAFRADMASWLKEQGSDAIIN